MKRTFWFILVIVLLASVVSLAEEESFARIVLHDGTTCDDNCGETYWVDYWDGAFYLFVGEKPEWGGTSHGEFTAIREINGYLAAVADNDIIFLFWNGESLEIPRPFVNSPKLLEYIIQVWEYSPNKLCITYPAKTGIGLWYMMADVSKGSSGMIDFEKSDEIFFFAPGEFFYTVNAKGLQVGLRQTGINKASNLATPNKNTVVVNGTTYLGWLGKTGPSYTTDGENVVTFSDLPKESQCQFFEGFMVVSGMYGISKIVPGEAPVAISQNDYEAILRDYSLLSPVPAE